MLIKDIRITPLQLPLKKPYVWAQGVEQAFTVNLVEIEAEDGTIGYGETVTAPDAGAQKIVLEKLAHSFVGQSIFDYAKCEAKVFKANFLAFGANLPRYANQMFSGLNMAVLDLQGKVWRIGLMGESARESNVFAFLSALERILPDQGYEVAYGSSLAAAQQALADFSG